MAAERLLILGDLAPLGRGEDALRSGDRQWLSEGLEPYWSNSAYRVVNLECPLIGECSEIDKLGPCLGVVVDDAVVLEGFSLVGLANNHIFDHGGAGLSHTIRLLDDAGIPHLGAGADLGGASRPHVAEIGGVRVGFLAWAHHEFCIATPDGAGAFPIDLTLGLEALEDVRERCDYVVLLYHGGVEHFAYPTPQQRRMCNFLAKRGADLIVCQHSHIVGASERVGDSLILYGQGNYCFDLAGKDALEHWYRGLMLSVGFEKGSPIEVEYIPIIQDRNDGMRPKVAPDGIYESILEQQRVLSENLMNDSAYAKIWRDFSSLQARNFLYEQLPIGRYLRKLCKTLKVLDSSFGRRRARWLLNKMECEAHADVLTDGLRIMSAE